MNELNLKPVKSEKNIIIELEKELPDELINKVYFRNGGNPYINYDKNHIFDGDGMIHVIEFNKREIKYQNRWIETFRFKLEKKYKKPLFVRLGNLTSVEIFTNFFSRFVLFEDMTNSYGEGTANTSIIYHNNKLLALNEMDKPYLLSFANNELKTVERYDFKGMLKHNMNAHPKIDPETGEMIGLGYDILKKKCYISYIDKNGKINKTINIKLERPILIHDVGITKNKVIILDLPLEFSLTNVIMAEFPIDINVEGESRIGLLDKKTDKTEWYKLIENEIIFHIANSWEEKDGKYIIIYAFCYDINNFDIKNLESQRPQLKKISINTRTKRTKVIKVSDTYGELPVIEDEYVGKKNKYIYYSRISDKGFDAIVKHNIETNEEKICKFPERMYGGENAIYGNYIINILYSLEEKESNLIIYNKNTLEMVRLIKLKCRIPFGFHGKIFKIEK